MLPRESVHTELCAIRVCRIDEANVPQRLCLVARRVSPRRQAQLEAPAHAYTSCKQEQRGNVKECHNKYNKPWVDSCASSKGVVG